MKRLYAIIVAPTFVIAFLIGILAFADDSKGIIYPAAYCFTQDDMIELREMLYNGEIERAVSSIDGRLNMETITFIINPRTGKFHRTTCRTINDIIYPVGYTGTEEEASAAGFSKCGLCLK